MSVLIKGMEMPKRCVECEWHEYYGGDYDWVHACRRTGTMPIENAETERANDCPLVEIPVPHGRLIDGDALQCNVDDIGLGYYEVLGVTEDTIDSAPTVIEAEGSEDDERFD